jgi:DNA-binding MarR family transcriptional regulator
MTEPVEKKPKAQNVRKNSIGWMLKTLCNKLDTDMAKALKQLGLSPGQFAILMALMEREGQTQTEIGNKMTMPGYATTRNIDALEKMSFVVRLKDERSRRSYRIYLTDHGRKIAPKLFETVGKVNKELLLPLGVSEQKQFKDLLLKVLKMDL